MQTAVTSLSMITLILEPHFDDTAYSMSGLLLSGVIATDPLIVTVFSQSTFAPYADASGQEQVSVLRYAEHDLFCKKIAARTQVLGYPEAPLRGWAINNIFDHRYGNDHERHLKQQIVADLEQLNEQHRPAQVYVPLGICGHIDHVLVRACAEQVFPSVIKYYEDLPYAGEIPSDEYNNWIKQLTGGLYPVTNSDTSTLEERIELLRYYESQVADKDIASVRKYVNIHQGERFWLKTN